MGKTVAQGNTAKTYNRSGKMVSKSVRQGNTVTTRDRTGRLVGKTTYKKR